MRQKSHRGRRGVKLSREKGKTADGTAGKEAPQLWGQSAGPRRCCGSILMPGWPRSGGSTAGPHRAGVAASMCKETESDGSA